MVGGLKQVAVMPGAELQFEQLFTELRETMRRTEPDCLYYTLLKARDGAGKYIVHELYRDAEALQLHEQSTHGAEYFPRIRALLESISVEYYDVVVA